jgi:hypothetical protein
LLGLDRGLVLVLVLVVLAVVLVVVVTMAMIVVVLGPNLAVTGRLIPRSSPTKA